MKKQSCFPILILSFLILGSTAAMAKGSIVATRSEGPRQMTKEPHNELEAQIRDAAPNGLENLSYRGFTILLNPLSNGSYEVAAFRVIAYGMRQVTSVYSSVYKSSVEYSYEYRPSQKQIVQYHYLFPPNSLTGWANPNEYAAMQKFDWGESYPIKTCSANAPIHTLEEAGREYLEAVCMPDRDTALRFARSFIDYMLSDRVQ